MDTTTSAMSSSLLARNVYCVCFPQRDGLDSLQGELAAARKKFFTGRKKTVRVGKAEIVKGFDGKLHGKLSKQNAYWKKSAGKVVLEESFDVKTGYIIVRRDFRDVIVSRTFFSKNHLWLKSEYYDPREPACAQVIFKPMDTSELVERFDWSTELNRYRATELHPLPYLPGTAEQSLLNARFGEPGLVISTGEGEFCYCAKKEAQARKRVWEEIKNGTIVLMPAWEVKDGALAGEEGEEETRVTFTSLEEYAKIGPGQETLPDAPAPSGPPEPQETEEFTPVSEPESTAEKEHDSPEDQQILAAARKAAAQSPGHQDKPREETPPSKETAMDATPSGMGYRGTVRDGKITGRGRTEQNNGLTAYEGDYLDGRRDGFGSYYYKDGSLCYAGFWKGDKRDGLGVSFRDSDHAVHISKWENGQPGTFVSLFDKDGSLRYGGRIENGKKEGAGVSFSQSDGTIFVGKWENGKPTGLGSSFDRDGNLLYYGGWKDGKRSGHGTEFDGSGGIVYDGEWKDGKYYNGVLYQKLTQESMTEEDAMLPWNGEE